MRRLVWAFAGRTYQIVGKLMSGPIYIKYIMVSEVESYDQLMAHDGAFAQFLRTYLISVESDEKSDNDEGRFNTVNVLKFWTLFSFFSQIKCLLLWLEFSKCLSEKQTRKAMIRLLLQKQSDLGLHCLPMPFWQATSVWNFRTFTVYENIK